MNFKNGSVRVSLPKFEPLDYVPYEDEKDEYTIYIREAFEASERKLNEWKTERNNKKTIIKWMRKRNGQYLLVISD